jgi:hypothetical protein
MAQVRLVIAKDRTSTMWTEANLAKGAMVWVPESVVEHLIENGICRWPEAAPQNSKPAGPSEIKELPQEPERPKSSGEAQAGRATLSPSSSLSGAARLSSASAAALLSAKRI